MIRRFINKVINFIKRLPSTPLEYIAKEDMENPPSPVEIIIEDFGENIVETRHEVSEISSNHSSNECSCRCIVYCPAPHNMGANINCYEKGMFDIESVKDEFNSEDDYMEEYEIFPSYLREENENDRENNYEKERMPSVCICSRTERIQLPQRCDTRTPKLPTDGDGWHKFNEFCNHLTVLYAEHKYNITNDNNIIDYDNIFTENAKYYFPQSNDENCSSYDWYMLPK
jgi:hypothetical protein